MEHPVLARSSSGLRHLRWAREVLGTLVGFRSFEAHLSDLQRAALLAEVAHVTAVVGSLSAAVKPYRDYLERTRTLARGKVRAAEHVARGEPSFASPPPAAEAEAARAEAHVALSSVIEPERRRLHVALQHAVDEARAGLSAMDERLARFFSPAFVDALYPPLTADRTRVLDDADPDDDSAG